MNKIQFEERLKLCGLTPTIKKKYTTWFLCAGVVIRSRNSGYSVHLWGDIDTYEYRKKLYTTINFSCSNDRFLLNLLGKLNESV